MEVGMGTIDMSNYTSPSPLMREYGSSRSHLSAMPSGSGPRSHTSSRTGSSHSELHRPQRHPRYNPTQRVDDVPCPDGYFHNPSKWMNPLCHEPKGDVDTCCLGCWFPDVLYGRIQYRLKQIAENKDPLDLKDYKCVNRSCGLFCLVGLCTKFDWTLIMLQHTRIRAIYNIEGTHADDLCSSFACGPCTLMQDDREIRAREQHYLKGEKEKNLGTCNHQPLTEPEMQYAAPHCGDLLRENTATPLSTQISDRKTSGQKSGKGHNSGQSRSHHGHKKLSKIPKIEINGRKRNAKGKKDRGNDISDATQVGNVYGKSISLAGPVLNPVTQYGKPDVDNRDVVLASRQTWKNQSPSGKGEGCPEHLSADCQGDCSRACETRDPTISRRTMPKYSEDATISQVRGKRVLKQLTKAGESPADESVLVFYDDVDQPQRHRISDCAKFRTSTFGRPNSPDHSDLPVDWRSSKIDDGGDRPENPKDVSLEHVLRECPVDNTTNTADSKKRQSLSHSLSNCAGNDQSESPKEINLEHVLPDCPVDNATNTADSEKPQSLSHSLSNCTGDGMTTKEVNLSTATPQHWLDDCPTDTTNIDKYSNSAENISQHNLTECMPTVSDSRPTGSATLDQHAIDGCPITDDTQLSKAIALDEHVIADGVVISDAQQFEKPDSNEQKEGHIATTVLQPPIIIITSTDVLGEIPGEQQDLSNSKDPEIEVISTDPRTPAEQVLRETIMNGAGPSEPKGNNDGATDSKDIDHLGQAAAALRKFLDAATAERRNAAAAAAKRSTNSIRRGVAEGKPRKNRGKF